MIILIDCLIDYCLMASKQYFSYIQNDGNFKEKLQIKNMVLKLLYIYPAIL